MAIGATEKYINDVKSRVINPATTSPLDRVARRPVSDAPPPAAPPVDVAVIKPPAVEAKALSLNPEVPSFDVSSAPFQQLVGNEATIFFLADGLPGLRSAAKDLRAENLALGGTLGA